MCKCCQVQGRLKLLYLNWRRNKVTEGISDSIFRSCESLDKSLQKQILLMLPVSSQMCYIMLIRKALETKKTVFLWNSPLISPLLSHVCSTVGHARLNCQNLLITLKTCHVFSSVCFHFQHWVVRRPYLVYWNFGVCTLKAAFTSFKSSRRRVRPRGSTLNPQSSRGLRHKSNKKAPNERVHACVDVESRSLCSDCALKTELRLMQPRAAAAAAASSQTYTERSSCYIRREHELSKQEKDKETMGNTHFHKVKEFIIYEITQQWTSLNPLNNTEVHLTDMILFGWMIEDYIMEILQYK